MPYHVLTTDEMTMLQSTLASDAQWTGIDPQITKGLLDDLWENLAEELLETHIKEVQPKPTKAKQTRKKKEPVAVPPTDAVPKPEA